MKTSMILFCLLVFIIFEGQSQMIVGLEGGFSTGHNSSRNAIFIDEGSVNERSFNLLSKSPVGQLGIFLQRQNESRFKTEYKLFYNQHELSYAVARTMNQSGKQPTFKTVNENLKRISLSTNFIYTMNNLEVSLGFVKHYNLSSEYLNYTDLDFDHFRQSLQYGAQAGVGFNFENLRLSIHYQLDFDKYGANFKANKRNLNLEKLPGRLIFLVGFKVGKLVKMKDNE